MKVLVLAPNCDGTDVGEAWSTHQWVARLGRLHDLTLLTTRRAGRTPPSAQLPHVRVVEWNELPVPARWERLRATLKPGYPLFALQARHWIRAAQRRGERFDLAHQLAPLALRYPSPLADGDTPYVLGPLAGSVEAPRSFDEELGGSAWYVRLRALDRVRLRHDPWLRRSFERASVVVGVAPYVGELLAGLQLARIEYAAETGVEELPPQRPARAARPGALELLYVGRVVRTKGVIFAIRAVAALADFPDVRLTVVGAGDDLERCRREAAALGVAQRVTFTGRVARAEVEERYRASDVFLFPSLREPSGNVVFESMRHGLAIVACRAGGPGHVLVDGENALLAPARDPDQFTAALAERVRRLALDVELRRRLGAGARERVADVALWDAKARWMSSLYSRVSRNETRRSAQPASI